jgi:hypothetical protein
LTGALNLEHLKRVPGYNNWHVAQRWNGWNELERPRSHCVLEQLNRKTVERSPSYCCVVADVYLIN